MHRDPTKYEIAREPRSDRPARYRVRISTLVLLGVFSLFGVGIAVFHAVLRAAHQSMAIEYFASDAATYFDQYYRLYADRDVVLSPLLLLNGTPIVLMMLSHGNLTLILAANLAIMLVTLKVGMDSFDSLGSRLAFLAGTLLFPYFLFGFLSLNKEIYAMCSAIFFARYWLKGGVKHLVVALALGFAARYFMLIAIAFLAAIFPRGRTPRYWLALSVLVGISMVAPFAKSRIPGYSSSHVLDGAGITGSIFGQAIDLYAYALIYPIKYLVLLPTRLYSVAIGLGRETDPMEAVVSLLSVVLLALSIYVLLCKRQRTKVPRRFVMMALIAPIPIMWTDIGHWRYFSYVYFFLLFAVIVHYAERRTAKRSAAVSGTGGI